MNTEQRVTVLKTDDKELTDSVCECVYNTLKRKMTLKNAQKTKGLFNSVVPLLRSGAKVIGKQALDTGIGVLYDVANQRRTFKDALRQSVGEPGTHLKRKAEQKINTLMARSDYKGRRVGPHRYRHRPSRYVVNTRRMILQQFDRHTRRECMCHANRISGCNQSRSAYGGNPHHVNSAFTTLRTLIPTEPVDRKLSKIETLRLASSYISHLQAQLVAVSRDYPRPFVRVFFIVLGVISTHPVSANLNVALVSRAVATGIGARGKQ
uniref:BHLH domain-containing protein n=1 Tax=Timema shepardi TaxID=629360 RepID=A0A7R9AUR8_TIMSH|nr:unnamed protein product [Timema shepardi]